MEKRECEICNRMKEVQVVSSSLGAMSMAYCSDCLLNNAEPKNLIRYNIEMADGKVAKWVLGLTFYDKKSDSYKSAQWLMDAYNNKNK